MRSAAGLNRQPSADTLPACRRVHEQPGHRPANMRSCPGLDEGDKADRSGRVLLGRERQPSLDFAAGPLGKVGNNPGTRQTGSAAGGGSSGPGQFSGQRIIPFQANAPDHNAWMNRLCRE